MAEEYSQQPVGGANVSENTVELEGDTVETGEEESSTPSELVQDRMVDTVRKTCEQYNELLKPYRERLVEIYKAYSTYKEERRADWATTFKINKAHEIVEKVLPRIVAKNPRWIVTPKIDDFYPDQPLTDEAGNPLTDPSTIPNTPETLPQLQAAWEAWVTARDKRFKQTEEFAHGVQDYLTYIFEEYDQGTLMRRLAKNMIVYGKGFGKICYKYETVNLYQGKDAQGKAIIKEDVSGEYPTIDIKSWTDVLYDPRYLSIREMPALVELMEGVRYWDLKRNEEKYFNLDKLKDMLGVKIDGTDMQSYKQKLRGIAGVEKVDIEKPIDENNLHLTCYYGLFQEDDEAEEKMVEMWCVGTDKQIFFPIYYKQITRIPFVDADCFEDPELNMPVGFVEPIISLQDEMNFKKNSASEYINHALNRSFIWSAQSGIDPRDLQSRPNAIIVTTKSLTEAEANFKEMEHRTIDPAYFQEQNDFERQMQSMSFTVDTSNQRSQQALTTTATGIRVAFFESNSVIDEVRKHWEQAMAALAYQLLTETFENMEDNIVLKKLGQAGFWEMNKELLRNAIMRYTIKIEANSSSYDDIDNRRQDAIGFWNICKEAKSQGVNVDMEECFREEVLTFEKKDPNRFIKPKSVQQIVADIIGPPPGAGPMPGQPGQEQPGMPPQGGPPGMPMEAPQGPAPEMAMANLTDQVAQGDISSAIPQ